MQKKRIFLVLLGSIALSCNNTDSARKATDEQILPDTVSVSHNLPDSLQTVINPYIIWEVEEGPGKEKLKKPATGRLDTLSSGQLINLLNQNYPRIQLNFIKISHDTLYVAIPESQRLTEELGDTGAENYLASATFTLTETDAVKFVNFNFKTGDHAEPGVYSRQDFKNLR